ncbi:MAG: hypothetical protein DRI44_08325 [Chlamydiae bacterium]|nr:MAG: hypothetical protein DRI44_08325 [Chlamydiota bacterium]
MKEKNLAKPILSFKFVVNDDDLPSRPDKYLAKKMPWRSRTFFQKMIKDGEVEINGKKCRRGKSLCANEIIIVNVSNHQQEFSSPESIPVDKIYEDEDILVINKAPGIIVHPTGRHLYNTLMNAVHSEYADADYRPRLVHRLDKDTSGVLVLAKNEFARSELARQIENREVKKIYLALVHGVFGCRSGKIELPIGQGNYSHIRIKQEISEKGLYAKSIYEILASAPCVKGFPSGLSLVKVRLITGRTHQIRLHLSAIGHPVLADKLYGRETNCYLDNIKINTQLLHAWKFGCHHPSTRKEIEFSAPLPSVFCDCVKKLFHCVDFSSAYKNTFSLYNRRKFDFLRND